MPEPKELKEYEYRVGHLPITAMLTEDQAERLGAVAPGTSEEPGTGNVVNNEANRTATAHRTAEDDGVDGPDTDEQQKKARTARNKRNAH
ncbi:MAG: hypothetical protein ABW022_04890 [Actinoplanes sp.]